MTTPPDMHGLRAGDRIKLLRIGEWHPPLEAEALAVLSAAVGQVHRVDEIEADGYIRLAFEVEPDHWHTFPIAPNDYEKAD